MSRTGTRAADLPGWQGPTLAVLLPALVERFPSAVRFGVTGSLAAGTIDGLSDLDLIAMAAELPDAAGDLAMLTVAGRVWSIERQLDDGERTLRVVYADGRRIDLLFRTAASVLPKPVLWLDHPTSTGTAPRTTTDLPDPARAEVLAVRHMAALAAAKLGRGDLLIGGHLCLEVARQSLVISMLVRDREEGRSHHHHGGLRDRDALRVSSALSGLPAQAGPGDWIDLLVRLTDVFDAAAGTLWPDHRPDWQGLDAIVVAARTAVADQTE